DSFAELLASMQRSFSSRNLSGGAIAGCNCLDYVQTVGAVLPVGYCVETKYGFDCVTNQGKNLVSLNW
ncbi:hypothetical protein ACCD01_31855, partial [Telluria sp. Tellsp99]